MRVERLLAPGVFFAMAVLDSERALSPRGMRSFQPTPMRLALRSLLAAMMPATEEP